MKKRIFSFMLAVSMCFSLAACGDSSNDATKKDDTKKEAAKTEAPADEDSANDDSAQASEDFTILDVTADLVDTAIYSVDDDNTEYVITLFRDPDGNNYISMMTVAADGSGDILCGAYDASCVSQTTDADNVDWTGFDVKDVYTDQDFSVIFTEGDDGSVAITNTDFSVIMEGQYLTNEEAVAYMAAAANYIP